MKGRRLAIQQGPILIGRDPECQIDLIDDEQVSRRHALIEDRSDGVYIRDLGSTNMVELNGQKVREAKLKNGDKFEIGRTLIQFQDIQSMPLTMRRDTSLMHVLALLAVVLVLAGQLLFILLFSNQTTNEVVALATIDNPPVEGESTQAVEQIDLTLEQEMQRVAAELASRPSTLPPGTNVLDETRDPGLVEAEVKDLRESVAELRRQIGELNKDLASVPSVTVDVQRIRHDVTLATEGVEAAAAMVATSAPAATGLQIFAEAAMASATADVNAVATVATNVSEDLSEADEPVPMSTPEPSPAPMVTPTVPGTKKSTDAITQRARELLTEALVAEAENDVIKADQLLERVQILAPDFVPAYVERARLYEARGFPKRAGEQWAQVMGLTLGSPLYEQAAAERTRLARAEQVSKVTGGRVDEDAPGSRLPRRIKISAIEREKFQSTKDYDEMRIVRINMKPRLSEGEIDPGDVEVMVTFYDRGEKSQEVRPSKAVVPENPMEIDGPWLTGQQKTISATYIVPKGFRARMSREQGEAVSYEGVRIQVYFRDQLQDEDAVPKSLLALESPDPPIDFNEPVSR